MSTLQDKANAQKAAATQFTRKIRRRRYLHAAISFVLVALLPTLATSLYFYVYAQDQFATEFRFAVRGREGGGGGSALGMLLGGGGALVSSSDSYIVVDYMQSLEMIRDLQERIDLIEIYSRAPGDPLHRYDGAPAAEDFLEYWMWKVDANYDLSRAITTVTVWSFDERDSLRIAREILALATELVDQLSREARQEALAYADEQVALAAEGMRSARQAIQEFRSAENVIDPTADVLRINEQISMLESTVIELTTELETQIATQGQQSASVQQLRNRVASTQKQLSIVRDSIDEKLPQLARTYESLQTELEIERQTFAAAHRARLEAEAIATQRQVYLSVYDTPKLAQTSRYPDRFMLSALVAGFSLLVWSIVYIVILNIRDAAS